MDKALASQNILKIFEKPIFAILAILCLGIIVYSNTFLCSFHFDDDINILHNPTIRNIHDLSSIWNWWPCRFITFISFALNYHYGQYNVVGFHILSLIIHLAAAIFLWWFTKLTFLTPTFKDQPISTNDHLIALFSALVFVSHPVQIQAVTYIWQRAASLAAMFYIASLSFYIKSRLLEEGRLNVSRVRFYYGLALFSAFFAMFSKENAITLPLMIVFYELSFFNEGKDLNWKRCMPFLLIFLIIPLVYLLTDAEKYQSTESFVTQISPAHYLLTEIKVMMTYIRLLFLPIHQNLDYDYPLSKSFFEIPVICSFFCLVAIWLIAIKLFSKYKLVSFSIFWFLLTLLPESSIIPFGDVIEEHRLYLPLAGYCLFLVSGLFFIFKNDSPRKVVIALMIIISFNAVLTFNRNKIWIDEITLWNDVIQGSVHLARPYLNRGLAYAKLGKLNEAIQDFNHGLEIDPKYLRAYYNQGLCYAKLGNLAQAISDYTKAIQLKPDYAEAFYNRGLCNDQLGYFNLAIRDYNRAIALNPKYAEAYNNLGSLLGEHGFFKQAIANFTKAIDINPTNSSIFLNRSVMYYQLRDYSKAWQDVHQASILGGVLNRNFINALHKASSK